MSSQPRFPGPVFLPDLDTLDSHPDPATRAELAHATAGLLVDAPGTSRTPAETARFVHLADELGLEVIAELWAHAPAVSLPGSLWRLYVVRQWIRTRPAEASRWFAAGLGDPGLAVGPSGGGPAGGPTGGTTTGATVAEVVAGVEDPPGPEEVARAADEILAGAFTGDYSLALSRAAAFVHVAARGRSTEGGAGMPDTPGAPGMPGTEDLAKFVKMAEDLATSARAYRHDHLD